MRFDGFIGPSYVLDSLSADCQRSVNLYPEAIESGKGQSVARLVATPGTVQFGAAIEGGPSRGHFLEPSTGRLFHVAGHFLYEVSAAGVAELRGSIAGSDAVSWASNRIHLAVCGGGLVYVLHLGTNALTQPTTGFRVVQIGPYFMTFTPGSQQFRISDALGGTAWAALDFASKEGFPDNLVTVFADHNEAWLMGAETCEPWGLVANPYFPMQRLSGTYIEDGVSAAASVAKVDNSLCWLGGTSRGGPIARRANGYTPMRISTHAQEQAWQKYARVDDAIGHAEVWEGHSFWVLTFPTADATWVYDVATGLWHERAYWDEKVYSAHRAVFHTVAFGKHLVSWQRDGNLYELSGSVYDDAGHTIRRERTFPHMSAEQARAFYSCLELLVEKGVGLTTGQGSNPQIMLQYSNDGGHTWGPERWISAGKVGEYRTRVRWTRLGSARDRVFRVAVTDPVFWAFIDAYLNAGVGTS